MSKKKLSEIEIAQLLYYADLGYISILDGVTCDACIYDLIHYPMTVGRCPFFIMPASVDEVALLLTK